MKNRQTMKGFTLVEAIVSAAIMAIITICFYDALMMGSSVYHSNMGLVELQQQARQAMYWMKRELRPGSLHYRLAIASAYPYDCPGIMFSTPDIQNICYYLNTNSHQIIHKQPVIAGSARIIANYVKGLTFCCYHDGICDSDCSKSNLIQIQLEAATTVMHRPMSINIKEEVSLRNE